MRRQFTLQLYHRPILHRHTCEVCSRQFNCGDKDCPGPDTVDICIPCCERYECPQCGSGALDMQWESDTVTEHGRITNFSAKCIDCGTGIAYQDNDDGRGAMRICWKPADPTVVQHVQGVAYPIQCRWSPRGDHKDAS